MRWSPRRQAQRPVSSKTEVTTADSERGRQEMERRNLVRGYRLPGREGTDLG